MTQIWDRLVSPAEFRSGDFLRAELTVQVIQEQESGEGLFMCSHCGEPHVFQVHCGECETVFGAAMVLFSEDSEIPGYLVIAGFCEKCRTVNFVSGNCPNVEGACLFEPEPI